jgi:hypothetical protein
VGLAAGNGGAPGKGPANRKGRGGAARGYSWPPFTPGHELSKVHGAYSERSVVPLAERIASSLLENAECPAYLREPVFAPVIAAWARSEAVVCRLWEFLGTQDVEEALSETITGTEDETHGDGGRVTRRYWASCTGPRCGRRACGPSSGLTR